MVRLRIIALSVLAGATLAVGAAAAIAFPTMKALDPVLAAYVAWPDPHWPIAAGAIANRLFRILDWVALGIVVVALVSMIPRSARPTRSLIGVVAAVSMLLLAGVVATNWVWIRPTMHHHLEAYWTAARAGDIAAGNAGREAFAGFHPIATGLLVAQAGLALICAAASRPWPLDRQQ